MRLKSIIMSLLTEVGDTVNWLKIYSCIYCYPAELYKFSSSLSSGALLPKLVKVIGDTL